MKIEFDQTSKDLLAAARYTERHASATSMRVPVLHLLNCVSMSLGLPAALHPETMQRYRACAKRLFDAIGMDLADFCKDEAIDMLVAAAYWNVPQAVGVVTSVHGRYDKHGRLHLGKERRTPLYAKAKR